MKRLKIVLQSKIFICIISLITIIYVYIIISNNYYHTSYNVNTSYLSGIIQKKYIDGNKLTIIIKAKEKVIVNYYLKNERELKQVEKYNLGDEVGINLILEKSKNNSNFNMFNYHKYLLSNKIFWIGNASNINLIKKNRNIGYKIKIMIQERIKKINSPYLYTFILGDNSYIDSDVLNNYRSNGISHLFALSGMHVSLIALIIIKILEKITKKRLIIIICFTPFLLFYAFLAGYNPSITRACLLTVLLYINNNQINSTNIFIILLCGMLIYNPYIVYSVSFQFSYIVSFYLIRSSNYFKNINNYFIKILVVSLISFIVGIPIMIYHFHSINLIGFVYNLFYIPFVSFIIFPLVIMTLFIPYIKYVLSICIIILEFSVNYISNINYGTMTLCHCSLVILIIYYIIISLVVYKINKRKYIYLVLILLMVIIHYNYPKFNNQVSVSYLDVSQGDSILLEYPYHKKIILIDTGGKVNYNYGWKKRKKEYSIVDNITIPYLKSRGIKNISHLILTHGDFDHMGEAKYLVENFKVDNVIFNCGPYNDLEKELIEVLKKKDIKYQSCINKLDIGSTKLKFLQTREYDNENDNSNVIYTKINNKKFLFMGDAGMDKEEDILEKYDLSNIDVLKVGHHGSNTSSSEEFIDKMNSKYSIISVGKKNRYGHPNKEVLDNLENSKIYRTDKDGSIMFKIKNNELKIETCSS